MREKEEKTKEGMVLSDGGGQRIRQECEKEGEEKGMKEGEERESKGRETIKCRWQYFVH